MARTWRDSLPGLRTTAVTSCPAARACWRSSAPTPPVAAMIVSFMDFSVLGVVADRVSGASEPGLAEVGPLYPDGDDGDDQGKEHGPGRSQEGAGEAGGQGMVI